MRQIAKQPSEVTLGLIRAIPPFFGPLALSLILIAYERRTMAAVAAVVK